MLRLAGRVSALIFTVSVMMIALMGVIGQALADEQLAFIRTLSNGRALMVHDLTSGISAPLTPPDTNAFRFSVAPDGQRIALTSDATNPDIGISGLFTMRIDGTNFEWLDFVYLGQLVEVLWVDDTRIVYTRSNQFGLSEIFLVDLADESITPLTSDVVVDAHNLMLTSDGRLAFETRYAGEFNIAISPIEPFAPEILTNQAGDNRTAAFSPSGDLVAFYNNPDDTERLMIMDVLTGEERIIDTGNVILRASFPPSWSPDGQTLVVDGFEMDVVTFSPENRILMIDVASGEVQVLPGSADPDFAMFASQFLPDGEKVLVRYLGQNGMGQALIDIATGQRRVITEIGNMIDVNHVWLSD